MSYNIDLRNALAIAVAILIVIVEVYPVAKDKGRIILLGEPYQKFKLNIIKVYINLSVVIILLTMFALLNHKPGKYETFYILFFVSYIFIRWFIYSREILIFNTGLYMNCRYIEWHEIEEISLIKNKVVIKANKKRKIILVNKYVDEAQAFVKRVKRYSELNSLY